MFKELSDNELYLISLFIGIYRNRYYNFDDLQRALYFELIDRGVVH